MELDQTQRPAFPPARTQGKDMERTMPSRPANPRAEQPAMPLGSATARRIAGALACPYCGEANEPEAMFCASCGKAIGTGKCPYCGAALDADADLCEMCHKYVRKDICSFCGGHVSQTDAFCPECGSPTAGIVCPVCHTMNEFSFCKQCGTPLTEEATKQLQRVKQLPEYQEMTQVAEQLLELEMQRPTTSQRDEARFRQADDFRLHVLSLLAKDAGVAPPQRESKPVVHYSKEQLAATKAEKEERLMELMEKLAVQPQQRQAKARTYALATKPRGMRLAWQCNWKHALHSSPCGCAKPNLGGKWVLMGKGMIQKDDK